MVLTQQAFEEVRLRLRSMVRRNVIYTFIYLGIVVLGFLPYVLNGLDLSDLPTSKIVYNALLLAVVLLLALDVVTLRRLITTGTVSAATGAVASNAATVVV